jgi:lysophospholipase L1-like esterase
MRSVGSLHLPVDAMNRRIGLSFGAGVLCVLMLWFSGCGSLASARSSTVPAMANPAAQHNPDYEKYRQGRLAETQRRDRPLYIAMIGDSLSRDFYVSSMPSCVWRSKMNHGRDWFLDTDPSPNGVDSLYERLARETPVVACEYSSVGGWVDSGDPPSGFVRSCFTSWCPFTFSQQVDLILKEKRFPDLVLIWIGHNNLHWLRHVDPRQPEKVEAGLQKMAANFRKDYERQLDRLVERAREQKQRRAIIVFGLVNFKSFFEARDEAERLRKENPKLYPYFEVDYQHYAEMKPEYRGNMVKLALVMNKELRAMVDEINQKLGRDSQVRLEYSDALAKLDLGGVEAIHQIDAWHPSVKGHNALAGAAFGALGPSLKFLGIAPLQKNADSH